MSPIPRPEDAPKENAPIEPPPVGVSRMDESGEKEMPAPAAKRLEGDGGGNPRSLASPLPLALELAPPP